MAQEDSVVIISSSPEFPSICDLLPKAVKKHQLRSGSNATPIPHDAPVAFTSAASLMQSSRVSQSESTAMHESLLSLGAEAVEQFSVSKIASPPPPAAEHTNPVSRGGKENPKITVTAKKKGKTDNAECRKAAAVPEAAVSTEAGHPKKQARKSRSRHDTAMAQTTLQKGKVTKVTAKEKQPIKGTETVSQHFAPQGPTPMPPSEPIPDRIVEESFVPEPASRRRLDWTPPRDSVPIVCLSDTSTTKDSPSAAPAQNDVFKTLHETYGLAADPDAGLKGTLSFPDTEVLGKRKLIEMASKGNKQTSPTASPTKPKAVKKKPRTITDLATAAYRQSDDEVISSKGPRTGPLLDYLGKPSEHLAVAAKGTSAKPKARRLIKPKTSKKKEQPHKPILLSPTSAMRQVAKQDFVFGTASQLATEDDPVLLRALHEAMKLSNQADNDTLASSSSVNSKLAIRKKTGAGLWAASARYENGNLLDMDVLDLTCSSPLPLDTNSPKTLRENHETEISGQQHERACIEIEMSENSFDLDLSPPMGHLKYLSPSPPFKGSPGAALNYGSASVNSRPQSPLEEPDFELPPSNQEQHLLMLSQSSSPRREEPALPPPPNYELYSDARLAREVASYGFKTVKKRTAMIALLNQCWESRNKATLGSRPTQTTMSTLSENATTSPSKPKGRATRTIVAPGSGVEPSAPGTRNSTKLKSAEAAENEVPQPGKRPRGRPRKNSTGSASGNAETSALAPAQGRRRKLAATSDTQNPGSQVEKLARGRTKKDATAPPRKRASRAKPTASPRQIKSPSKRSTPAPSTPHCRCLSKEVLEIPDSDLDDPFASTPESSPERQLDLFSSPPAMDLSVTEDTEASLVASPTSQQVSLFQYITKAIVNAPRATNPAEPSWHEKMLMYDPIILEDLTAWLNAGQLDKVGYDGEVSPGDVKKWCESKSVCCLWRVNLRGQERKRF
ncbi:hypothetical protein C7999DRAFT_17469 [Corynascus novoguineensis]|uniref:Structure-specific endonuclease subunit SLX4 n=1 Tax=Corynascus novoguineensis TaxID=1126955 RepID=A0AAN7HC08_9PEZI|nr:hypothetical protein C7999DRAFT_17469 [Corynascus novoguineensis]